MCDRNIISNLGPTVEATVETARAIGVPDTEVGRTAQEPIISHRPRSTADDDAEWQPDMSSRNRAREAPRGAEAPRSLRQRTSITSYASLADQTTLSDSDSGEGDQRAPMSLEEDGQTVAAGPMQELRTTMQLFTCDGTPSPDGSQTVRFDQHPLLSRVAPHLVSCSMTDRH